MKLLVKEDIGWYSLALSSSLTGDFYLNGLDYLILLSEDYRSLRAYEALLLLGEDLSLNAAAALLFIGDYLNPIELFIGL